MRPSGTNPASSRLENLVPASALTSLGIERAGLPGGMAWARRRNQIERFRFVYMHPNRTYFMVFRLLNYNAIFDKYKLIFETLEEESVFKRLAFTGRGDTFSPFKAAFSCLRHPGDRGPRETGPDASKRPYLA